MTTYFYECKKHPGQLDGVVQCSACVAEFLKENPALFKAIDDAHDRKTT